MKMKQLKKLLSLTICIVLIAAMALMTSGCNNNTKTESPTQKSFVLTVVDLEGVETKIEVTTDKTTVGDALLEKGIIDGYEGPYGLTVETVNGITVNFNNDGRYWAFYINGEYAMTGVDSTDITDGDTYSFKVEQ